MDFVAGGLSQKIKKRGFSMFFTKKTLFLPMFCAVAALARLFFVNEK